MNAFRPIVQFFRLSPTEQMLVVEAAILGAAYVIGLRLFPRLSLRLLREPSRRVRGRKANPADIETIATTVERVGRFVPGASCIVQAVTARQMLARRGWLARVHVGFAPSIQRPVLAHAWLELDGVVLLGGSNASVARYVPLSIAPFWQLVD
jgi:hypothetical protein